MEKQKENKMKAKDPVKPKLLMLNKDIFQNIGTYERTSVHWAHRRADDVEQFSYKSDKMCALFYGSACRRQCRR